MNDDDDVIPPETMLTILGLAEHWATGSRDDADVLLDTMDRAELQELARGFLTLVAPSFAATPGGVREHIQEWRRQFFEPPDQGQP